MLRDLTAKITTRPYMVYAMVNAVVSKWRRLQGFSGPSEVGWLGRLGPPHFSSNEHYT